MIDYIKDWRIWVLATIILLIIRFPLFGEEIKVEPVKKRSNNIEFKYNDVKLKWKINRFETKWKASDRFNVRHNFVADDFDQYRTAVLFTLEF